MQEINGPEQPTIWRDHRAIALMMAASLTVMTAATISPALPGLERQFASSETNAFLTRLLVPAPSLAVVLVAPLCGAIADRSGRRRMLLFGLSLFILAGSAGLILPTLPLILISRLCLGVALAMIMTAQSALMADYFSGKALHAVSSGQISARNFGGFVFIILAGLLALGGPRWPFTVYALPVLALPFFWRVISDPPAARNDQSVPSDSSSPRSHQAVRLLAIGQMGLTMLFFVMPTQLPFFLADTGHTSPAMTGAALGVLMLAGGAAALVYPRVQTALGNAGNWACGFGLMAVGFAILIGGHGVSMVLIGSAAIGAGYALAAPGFVALSLAVTVPEERGKTGALLTGSVFLGQFLSPFMSNPAIAMFGWHASGFSLAITLAIIAVICAVFSRRSSH